tara:strand:- start:53 stop:850 length:798 start_codon:yes stop_codon:yes gene_type:complete
MAITKEDLAARAAAIKANQTKYTRPSDGQVYNIRNLNNPRHSRTYGGQGGRDEVLKTRQANRGSEARRAATTGQLLTEQDYLDYARKNNYPDELAKQLYQQNVDKLRRLKRYKSAKFNYEHLLPTTSKAYGGVEHWRNIILMGADENAAKSDKLISMESAREAKIPLSKASALQKDFAGAPNPTPRQKREIVRREMQQPLPTARQKSQAFQRLRVQLATSGGGVKLQPVPNAPTKRQILGQVLAGAATATKTIDTGLGGFPIKIP